MGNHSEQKQIWSLSKLLLTCVTRSPLEQRIRQHPTLPWATGFHVIRSSDRNYADINMKSQCFKLQTSSFHDY